jgi:ASC-1-like (ASCH) protein
MHEMKLNPQPFAKMAEGTKTIEIRLNDEKRRLLKVGDTIEFTRTDGAAKLIVEIIALHQFLTFRELYEKFPPAVCGSEYTTVEERIADTYKTYYSPKREKEWGVLGIEIKLIDHIRED